MAPATKQRTKEQLLSRAKELGIQKVDDDTSVESASRDELEDAIQEFEDAQLTNVGAGGEDEDEGTAKNAERSAQRPAPGDPRTVSDVKGAAAGIGE